MASLWGQNGAEAVRGYELTADHVAGQPIEVTSRAIRSAAAAQGLDISHSMDRQHCGGDRQDRPDAKQTASSSLADRCGRVFAQCVKGTRRAAVMSPKRAAVTSRKRAAVTDQQQRLPRWTLRTERITR